MVHSSSKRQLQDLRVYNHALSPREVKLLAQGLILHLPLKDGNMENTTNLDPYPSYNGTPNREWEAALHTKSIKVTGGWSDGYNGGVSSSASGYHALWVLITHCVFVHLWESLSPRHPGVLSSSPEPGT